MTNQQTNQTAPGAPEAPTGHAGYSKNFDVAKAWKAYNKGCDHKAYGWASARAGVPTYEWDKWSDDERKAYLRGYNGQFINSESYK